MNYQIVVEEDVSTFADQSDVENGIVSRRKGEQQRTVRRDMQRWRLQVSSSSAKNSQTS